MCPAAVTKYSYQSTLNFWLTVQATVHRGCRSLKLLVALPPQSRKESNECALARVQFALPATQFRIPLPKA